MYGCHDEYWHNKKADFKEADPVQIAKYRRHVAAGTVPPESQIPYTRTGVEKYRHSCVADEFKPGAKPVYPSWATTKSGIQREILKYQMERKAGGSAQEFKKCYPMPSPYITETKEYVKQFNQLRRLK
jgi:hypothetical protein